MSDKDGGPAFPGEIEVPYIDGYMLRKPPGMSLRDYFAGQALVGWLSGPCGGDVMNEYEDDANAFQEHQCAVAVSCYGYADAMLKAREP